MAVVGGGHPFDQKDRRRPYGLLVLAVLVVAALWTPQAFAGQKALAGHVSCPSGNAAITNTSLTVIPGGTATASFKIAAGCSHIQVSLASYDAPSASFALPQTLIDSKTGTYNAGGPYSQTVVVSPCFFQVDLARGAVITNLTTSNLYGDRLLLSKNGGNPCASKMTTSASASVDVGNAISDSAILSGVSTAAGGTITFKAYPPSATTCTGTPAWTSAAISVHGSGTYGSGSFTPITPTPLVGTYRWTAAYTGDPQNAAVSLACNATGESVIVRPRTPTLSTNASAAITIGSTINDTATLGGTYNGTGTITFKLYGPTDTMCTSAAIFMTTKSVAGNGNYTSATFLPTAVGTYRWVASYGGDVNNSAVNGACNGANEAVVVSPHAPTMTTQVDNVSVKFGSTINDTATLGGTYNGTGTITFNLYGPTDTTCTSAPIFTTTKSVAGNGNYTSATFLPTAVGTYRWVASYGGDVNNSAVSGACNGANEAVVVSPHAPTMTTQVDNASVKFGTAVKDTATIAGAGAAAGGTITFKLYGPNDGTCANAAVFTSAAIPVSGNGSYSSGFFTPLFAGTYRWTAAYTGDLTNLAIPAACNQNNESVVVGDKDTTPPTCVATGLVNGPPKQVKITVQDAESGIATITVNTLTNATIAPLPSSVPAGTTAPVLITATKSNQTQSSFIRLTVTNGVGLATVCDPVLPAVKKTHPSLHKGMLHVSASGFSLVASVGHMVYGAARGVTLSGQIAGAAGQTVTLMSQSCKFNSASALAKVKIGKTGAYSFHFQPALSTVFSLRWGGVTKTATVAVQPLVALTRESAGRYRIDVSTTNGVFLDGKQVVVQRRVGSRWVDAVAGTLAKSSSEDLLTVTSSITIAENLYGAKLRAALPATGCYAGAVSSQIVG